jgi:hypothetical protein
MLLVLPSLIISKVRLNIEVWKTMIQGAQRVSIAATVIK